MAKLLHCQAKRFIFVLASLLTILACTSVLSPLPLMAQETSPANLETEFTKASKWMRLGKWEKVIEITTRIVASESFQSASPSFRSQTYLLLARSYFLKGKLEQVEGILIKLLEVDSSFDIDKSLPEPELVRIAKEILAARQQSASPPRRYFRFESPPSKISVKAGSVKRQLIKTAPASVPVRFALTQPHADLSLIEIDSISAELEYRPDVTEADSMKRVLITASSVDTTRQLELTFQVTAKGGGISKWVYIAGGAVVAGTGVYFLTSGGGGGDETATTLPGPPGPPEKR